MKFGIHTPTLSTMDFYYWALYVYQYNQSMFVIVLISLSGTFSKIFSLRPIFKSDLNLILYT